MSKHDVQSDSEMNWNTKHFYGPSSSSFSYTLEKPACRHKQAIISLAMHELLKGTTGRMRASEVVAARSGHTCIVLRRLQSRQAGSMQVDRRRRGVHMQAPGNPEARQLGRSYGRLGRTCAIPPRLRSGSHTSLHWTRSTINITTSPSFDDRSKKIGVIL